MVSVDLQVLDCIGIWLNIGYDNVLNFNQIGLILLCRKILLKLVVFTCKTILLVVQVKYFTCIMSLVTMD